MVKSALIVAHGSSEDRNGNAAEIQAERIASKLGIRVEYVYKSCSHEEMEERLIRLSEDDVGEIVVIPLFFASSVFSEKMVPEKLGLSAGDREDSLNIRGRSVRVRVVTPFGTDPMMRSVLENLLGRMGAEAGTTAVMLVGHGSKDGANVRAVEYNAGIVRSLGYDAFACYNEMCEPTVEQCLEEVLSGGFTDILVVPLFVSSGHHSVVEIPEKLGLEDGSRERTLEHDGTTVTVRYSNEIGLEPGIADILCRMVEEQ